MSEEATIDPRETLDRLERARVQLTRPDSLKATLSEAVSAVAALDGYWLEIPGYEQDRFDSEAGCTVAGLLHVQSFHPSLWSTAHPGLLVSDPATDLKWTSADKLPREVPSTRFRGLYAEHVAGRPLGAPLDVAAEWFWNYASR
jgi:hypothetical protein